MNRRDAFDYWSLQSLCFIYSHTVSDHFPPLLLTLCSSSISLFALPLYVLFSPLSSLPHLCSLLFLFLLFPTLRALSLHSLRFRADTLQQRLTPHRRIICFRTENIREVGQWHLRSLADWWIHWRGRVRGFSLGLHARFALYITPSHVWRIHARARVSQPAQANERERERHDGECKTGEGVRER